MRFIHCADIHLGCNQFNIAERSDDFFAAFSYIIDKTLEAEADALVIAGDLFHQRSIDAYTLERASICLERLRTAGVRVFLTEGNHDKQYYTEKKSWCAFLHSEGLVTLLNYGDAPVEYKGVRFVGLGFCGSLTVNRIKELAETLSALPPMPAVLLLHAGVNYMADTDSGLRCRDMDCLKGLVSYAALGHIHRPYSLDGWLFNPGSSENVHLGEAVHAERGFYDVLLDGGSLSVRLCTVPMRPVRSFTVELPEPEKILAALPDGLENSVLRLYIKTSGVIDIPPLREMLRVRTGCLYADVFAADRAVPDDERGELPELAELEKDVIAEMAREYGFADADAACRIILGLKESLLNGEAPEAVAEALYREFANADK